jgi:hypothetical protein
MSHPDYNRFNVMRERFYVEYATPSVSRIPRITVRGNIFGIFKVINDGYIQRNTGMSRAYNYRINHDGKVIEINEP